MSNATIKDVDGVLTVERDGYQWARTNGRWFMKGHSGEWFPCEIQDHSTRQQVEDFENCLRSYSFEEGPDYPKGRKSLEPISDFIKRKQVEELRAGIKDIFKPVPMHRPAIPRTPISRLLKPYSAAFRKHLTS